MCALSEHFFCNFVVQILEHEHKFMLSLGMGRLPGMGPGDFFHNIIGNHQTCVEQYKMGPFFVFARPGTG